MIPYEPSCEELKTMIGLIMGAQNENVRRWSIDKIKQFSNDELTFEVDYERHAIYCEKNPKPIKVRLLKIGNAQIAFDEKTAMRVIEELKDFLGECEAGT